MTQQKNTIKDIIKIEIKKCKNDPVYFLDKYASIQHPDRGKIQFKMWDFQKELVSDGFQQYMHNIILKSRQLGISTVTAGYALWLALFHSDKTIRILATSQDTSKNMITKVNYMYYSLPRWLRSLSEVTEDNKLSMGFSNGSSIRALSSTPTSGRSESLSLLIIDEAAFIEYAEENSIVAILGRGNQKEFLQNDEVTIFDDIDETINIVQKKEELCLKHQ